MPRLITSILIISVILFSCSDTQSSAKHDIQKPKVEPAKVIGNRILTLEIEGMTCVMGCGGSIRKQLKETNAIESCEFQFEEGRAKNVAKIAFDKDKISVDKIISIVSTINKGQFKVGSTSSDDISVNIRTKVEEITTDKPDDARMKVSAAPSIEIPNFMEILASFFYN